MEMTSLSFYLESKSLINELNQGVMRDQIDPTLFKKRTLSPVKQAYYKAAQKLRWLGRDKKQGTREYLETKIKVFSLKGEIWGLKKEDVELLAKLEEDLKRLED